MSAMTMAECPFGVGEEVTVVNGVGGKPIKVARVQKVYNAALAAGRFQPGWRVVVEGMKAPFSADSFGVCSFYKTRRYYLIPATDAHREEVGRKYVLERLRAFVAWGTLPTPVLNDILTTIQAYRPGGSS